MSLKNMGNIGAKGFKYIGGNCGGAKKIGDGWFKKFANGEMGSKKSSGWVGIVQFTICHLGQFGAQDNLAPQ